MNKLAIITVTILCMVIISCGGSGKYEATADGFSEIEKEIKSEFSDEAYFTDLTITYNESIGNIIGVTVTKDPESMQMGQWNYMQGAWKQNSEITLEVPEGTKAADFMYQLNEEINLAKLGALAEKSKEQLIADESIGNPILDMALIKFPKNGDVSKTEYVIMLKPETGGTTFTFRYKLNGEQIK